MISNVSKSLRTLGILVLVYVLLAVIGAVTNNQSLEGPYLKLYLSGLVIFPFISGFFAIKGIRNGEGSTARNLLALNVLIFIVGLFFLYTLGFGRIG